VKYQKHALSFTEQADRLLARGLVADRSELIDRLASVNYYRLSAYWYTFRIEGDPDERLIPGTTLATVWKRYVFDRQLRLLVMDAIERVEVAIRTQIVNRVQFPKSRRRQPARSSSIRLELRLVTFSLLIRQSSN